MARKMKVVADWVSREHLISEISLRIDGLSAQQVNEIADYVTNKLDDLLQYMNEA